jgi:hypothetical protein
MKNMIFILLLILISDILSAQTSSGNRESRNNFDNGDIVAILTVDEYSNKAEKSSLPYQAEISAVYNKDAASVNKIPFIRNGEVLVKFTSSNGHVKKGDYLTSSEIPGTAMKATKSGKIIGVALEDSQSDNQLLKISVQPEIVEF